MNGIKPLMLKDLPEEERPREKLLNKGAQTLSNAELLAILLRTGTSRDSVLRVAEKVMAMYENMGLSALATVSPQELSKVRGIGKAKAVTVTAAIELGKRMACFTADERPIVRSPQDVAGLLMGRFRYEQKEHFIAVLLSTKHHVLAMPVISIGSLNASIVHPRELFREAIQCSAAAVILVHNHPSGDPTPSTEDVLLTKKMVESGRILDISVLDHLILGDNKYVSLKEKGII
jgi:DNA repair protein RadC